MNWPLSISESAETEQKRYKNLLKRHLNEKTRNPAKSIQSEARQSVIKLVNDFSHGLFPFCNRDWKAALGSVLN